MKGPGAVQTPFSHLVLDVLSTGQPPGLAGHWSGSGLPEVLGLGEHSTLLSCFSAKLCQPVDPCPVLPKGPWGAKKAPSSIWTLSKPLSFLPLDFLSPHFAPKAWMSQKGGAPLLARLNFAGWEIFRVLIKRNHPERMTSLVHTHTLLPCPLQWPHSHTGAH